MIGNRIGNFRSIPMEAAMKSLGLSWYSGWLAYSRERNFSSSVIAGEPFKRNPLISSTAIHVLLKESGILSETFDNITN